MHHAVQPWVAVVRIEQFAGHPGGRGERLSASRELPRRRAGGTNAVNVGGRLIFIRLGWAIVLGVHDTIAVEIVSVGTLAFDAYEHHDTKKSDEASSNHGDSPFPETAVNET